MLLNNYSSSIFGEMDVKLETALKNPNRYREAVIFESINNLSPKKVKEFINSKEAKHMLEEGIICQDTLDRLANESDTGCLKTTVCHMAKENGDPEWDELIRLRIEERRVMNELLEKYGDKAKAIADNADKDFVEAFVPEYFRSK